MVISPIIAVLMVFILGLDGLESTVTVVEAGMPSAMLSLVLAASYDLDIKAAAACIFHEYCFQHDFVANTDLSALIIPSTLKEP